MQSFKDVNGKNWVVSINVNAIKRCRDLANFDLLTVADDHKVIASLSGDPVKVVNLLYAVCKPDADAAGITDEQFGEALGNGDVIEAATTALLGDLVSFFPKHRRDPLNKAIAKLDQYRTKAAAMAIHRLESPEMDRQVEAILTKAINSPLSDAGD